MKISVVFLLLFFSRDLRHFSIEVVEIEDEWPCIGVTGPEGEYEAVIGENDSSSPYKSRYGDQGVGMYMNRYLRNNCKWDSSLWQYKAIKTGDVIRMFVKNHTLTYYHNNVKLTFKDDPITLLKDRDYKFAVGLWGRASVRIV